VNVLDDPIERLVKRIQADLIGGAADMAKEAATAVADMVAHSVDQDSSALLAEYLRTVDKVIEVTPGVMPVVHVLHRIGNVWHQVPGKSAAELRGEILQAVANAIDEIDRAVTRVGLYGAHTLSNRARLFTYSISSSVFAMIREAVRDGKSISVVTTESRPGNEGLQTLEAMKALDVPVTIGVDAALATLMKDCDSVYVGADTITATGDALCKIGSFSSALAARHYGIPFRVAADVWKFDPSTLKGIAPRPMQMPASDIVPEIPPDNTTVKNAVFELVPARFIDSIISDQGVIPPPAAYALMRQIPECPEVAERLMAARQPSRSEMA